MGTTLTKTFLNGSWVYALADEQGVLNDGDVLAGSFVSTALGPVWDTGLFRINKATGEPELAISQRRVHALIVGSTLVRRSTL